MEFKDYKVLRDKFYKSNEWLKLRYKVLQVFGRKCMLCHATNLTIHVDHIKPLSKYWHLRLDINNLQVLCEDCNLGKSNIYEHDFRPKKELKEKLEKQRNAGIYLARKKRKCRLCAFKYDVEICRNEVGAKGYCSKLCLEKMHIKRKEERENKLRLKPLKKCKLCSVWSKGGLDKRNGYFCNKGCKNSYLSKMAKGESHIKVVLRKKIINCNSIETNKGESNEKTWQT